MKERVNFPVSSQLGGCFVVTRGLLTINLLFGHPHIDTVGVRRYDEGRPFHVCPFMNAEIAQSDKSLLAVWYNNATNWFKSKAENK